MLVYLKYRFIDSGQWIIEIEDRSSLSKQVPLMWIVTSKSDALRATREIGELVKEMEAANLTSLGSALASRGIPVRQI